MSVLDRSDTAWGYRSDVRGAVGGPAWVAPPFTTPLAHGTEHQTRIASTRPDVSVAMESVAAAGVGFQREQSRPPVCGAYRSRASLRREIEPG